MKFLGNNNIKNSVKFSVLLNVFTYFFLIWNPCNDLCNAGNNFAMKYQHDRLLNKSNNRLLAKHGTQKDSKYTPLRDKLSDDGKHMNLKYRMNNMSTYDRLNKKSLNDLDAYNKRHKNRYSKKKGLAKLDCYCEKMIFDKIEEVYELSKIMQNKKKNIKKKIYNKFGYHLILFALSPVFGIIFPALFLKNGRFSNWCTSDCGATSNIHKHTGYDDQFIKTSWSSTKWNIISSLHALISFTLCIIVLTVIIYALVKVVKYEKLKAGKEKIKGNDYYRFCKNIFI